MRIMPWKNFRFYIYLSFSFFCFVFFFYHFYSLAYEFAHRRNYVNNKLTSKATRTC